MVLRYFIKYAINLCGLKTGQPVLAGVSGGADSLCMADCLIRCGFETIIAHFNHHLREDSGRDADLVEAFAKSKDVSFILGERNVREFSENGGFSIEEGARNARYEFLFNEAKKIGAQAVAVGHNADDQAETVLMHFLRGSGVNGLRGMMFKTYPNQFSETIPLVRPLLRIPRNEIDIYCSENEIQFTRDESNFDKSFFRNRLRLELIPTLETYQPGIRQRLEKTSILMAELDEIMKDLTSSAWDRVKVNQGPGFTVLSLPKLITEPRAVKRGLIRQAIQHLRPGLREIDFDCVARIINLIDSDERTGRTDILQDLEAVLEGDRLVIKETHVQDTGEDWLRMDPEQILQMKELEWTYSVGNWEIRTELLLENRDDFIQQMNADSLNALLDLDTLKLPLIIRTGHPGDRIQPFGMDGHTMKLADFWINEGLPKRARRFWPLVCDQQGICWIPGYRIMHPYRITTTTKNKLGIKILRS
jgi:tRNA(Ile)-lysidine synthase